MVSLLSDELVFPDPETANEDGLVAVGGDLSPERILTAYASGIFPWPIFEFALMTWFSPDPRAILELEDLHISRSLRRVLNRKQFEVRFDTAFDEVVEACAAPGPGRTSTWITPGIKRGYSALHNQGHAHSVEVYQDHQLVGGMYGVSIGALFAGESMFSRMTNGSKIALVHLVEHLRSRNITLFDIQQTTPHMQSMGASEISRTVYLRRLRRAIQAPTSF